MRGSIKSSLTFRRVVELSPDHLSDPGYLSLANYSLGLRQMLFEEQAKSQFLVDAIHDSLVRLARTCAFRDHETGEHIHRLGRYAAQIARCLSWSEADCDMLAKAVPMHDLGKIAIPDAILMKLGPLTPEEWRIMESHTIIGAKLLEGSQSPLMQMARQIALTHHERWDGTGYPYRLQGEQIPMCGRNVMLADQYDALHSHRNYKPPFSHETTCNILLKGDGRTEPRHFDPLMLELFADLHQSVEEHFGDGEVLRHAS